MSDIDFKEKEDILSILRGPKPSIKRTTAESLRILKEGATIESAIIPSEDKEYPQYDLPQPDRPPDDRIKELWQESDMGERFSVARILAYQLEMNEREALRNVDTLTAMIPGTDGDVKKAYKGFSAGWRHAIAQGELNKLSYMEWSGQIKQPEVYEAQIAIEKQKLPKAVGIEEIRKQMESAPWKKILKLERKHKQAIKNSARMEELEKQLASLRPEDARWYMPNIGWNMANISTQMLQAMREGLAMSLGPAAIGALAGGPPGAAVGFTFGVGAGMGTYNTRQMIGASWRKMLREGVDPKIARGIALGSGVIQGAIEYLQMITLIKALPGVDKALVKAAENAVKMAMQNGTLKSIAGRATKRMLEVGAIESIEEVMQNTVDSLADYMAIELTNRYKPDEYKLKHEDWRDFIKEQAATVIAMFPSTALIGMPGAAYQFSTEAIQMQKEKAIVVGIIEKQPEGKGILLSEWYPEIEKPVKAEVIERPEIVPLKKVRPKPKPPVDEILHPEEQVKPIPAEEAVKKAKQVEKEITEAYETQKEVFFRRRDKRLLKTKVEKRLLQKELKTVLGKKKFDVGTKNVSEAIDRYIDTKRDPESINKYYDQLTDEDKKITDLSQNLPKEVKGIIDKINKSYQAIGKEALSEDVIYNTLENYTGRVWDRKGEEAAPIFRKFGTTSRHAKARVFDTKIEGLAKGYKLKIKGAMNNLAILKEEMTRTIENKRFLKAMMRVKEVDGNPLLTTKKLEGYKEIKHPNFVTWRFAGQVDPYDQTQYGKNFFVTDKGTLLEKTRLYAPEKIAKNLNNIFGVSALKDVPGIKTITKYNALIKSWILQSTFFHHGALGRSYYLGGDLTKLGQLSIRQAFKNGIKSIENLDPDLVMGVEEGLTLGLIADWQESLLEEGTFVGKILDKNKVTKAIQDKIMDLRHKHVEFLFGEFSPGIKATTYLIEFRKELKRNPNQDPRKAAKYAAGLINDDFGGLHLERMGRSPTVQHIFRIFALAPDWTESNVRSMIKAIKGGDKQETAMYRRFWARVMIKGAALTAFANFLLAGGDPEEMIENYERAWEAGNFKWLDMDITPVYKLFGGKTSQRKYLSIFGHFKDPLKFFLHPIRSAHYKGSVAYGIIHEALVGADWAGRKFTTFQELLESGQTVKWGPGRPISYEQLPAYILSQLKGTQPVQIQNLISWANGEMEAFDAIANSLGLGVRTTYK